MDSENTATNRRRGFAICVAIMVIFGFMAGCQKEIPAARRETPPASEETSPETIAAPDHIVLDREITDDQINATPQLVDLY